MDLSSRRIAMKVAAQHAAKQAVELALCIGTLAAQLEAGAFEVESVWARGNIAAIRRELSDLEHLLAGRWPPVEAAPTMAAE